MKMRNPVWKRGRGRRKEPRFAVSHRTGQDERFLSIHLQSQADRPETCPFYYDNCRSREMKTGYGEKAMTTRKREEELSWIRDLSVACAFDNKGGELFFLSFFI